MKADFTEFYRIEKLEELFKTSHQEPVVFFKHSITCPISRNAFDEVAKVDSKIWVMVVQDAEKVSKAIAKKTNIKHESPQTIIIKNGEPIYDASHHYINSEQIAKILSENSEL